MVSLRRCQMARPIVLLLLLSVPVSAQSYDNPIIESLKRYNERRRQDRLDRAAEDQRQFESRLARERLELERRQLELETRPRPTLRPEAAAVEKQRVALQVNEAVLALAKRYPDFVDYADAAADLVSTFPPGNSSRFSVERYLESLYLIAKYTTKDPDGAGSRIKEPSAQKFISRKAEPLKQIILAVTSDPPGAGILLNGKFVGSTPTTKFLEAGEYSVEVSKRGFEGWTRSVNLKSGDSVTLHAELPNIQSQPVPQNESSDQGQTDQPKPIKVHGLPTR